MVSSLLYEAKVIMKTVPRWLPVSEEDARKLIIKKSRCKGKICSKCHGHRVIILKTRYVKKCLDCLAQTSIFEGSIFKRSRVPIITWLNIMWSMLFDKNVTTVEISKTFGLSYKTALSISSKLRMALPDVESLSKADRSVEFGIFDLRKGIDRSIKILIIVENSKKLGWGENKKRLKISKSLKVKMWDGNNVLNISKYLSQCIERGTSINICQKDSWLLEEFSEFHFLVSKGESLPFVTSYYNSLVSWINNVLRGGVITENLESYLTLYSVINSSHKKADKEKVLKEWIEHASNY
jgi:hypothetical protein